MNKTRAVVIYLLILTLMGSIPTLLAWPIPAESKDLLNIVLGFFVAKAGDAIAYLLNSTEGSKAKTDAMVALASRAGDPPPDPRPFPPDDLAIPDPPPAPPASA